MLWMVLATLLFSTMHGIIRHLSAEQHPFQLAFLRNAFGLLVFVPWIIRRGLGLFHTQRFSLHVLRAGIMSLNMLTAFTAISLIPLAQVAALQMTMPLIITLGAIVFLGEKARIRRWTALLIGFIGTLIIIRPGVEDISLGVMLMLAVVFMGATGRLIGKLMTRSESTVTISAYMNVLMTPLTLIPAVFVWQPLAVADWGWLLLLGLCGTLAQMIIIQAYRVADMGVVEPVTFLRLLWATLIGFWFFAESPDLWVWLGGLIIFASASYIAHREAQLKRRGINST